VRTITAVREYNNADEKEQRYMIPTRGDETYPIPTSTRRYAKHPETLYPEILRDRTFQTI